MNRVLLGTKNEGKLLEAKGLLAAVVGLELLTFRDVPFGDVDETGDSFLDNALLKAMTIGQETGMPVLSEDAGLQVVALNGAPGVRSARYAGEPCDPRRNNERLLLEMRDVDDRRARFMTVAALHLPDGQTFVTTGILPGILAREPVGDHGFGYDPLFVPDGRRRTLAQMTVEEKNRLSHRSRALSRMNWILRDLLQTGELGALRSLL